VSFPELALLILHAERIQAQPEIEGNTARAKAARECEAFRVAAGPNRKLDHPFWDFYMDTVRMALAVGGMAEKDSENDQQRHENSHLISPHLKPEFD
jgi:hypothetical protein